MNAKTTLPWFLAAAGAPSWIAPLLVPIRESGSMLPQAALRPWLDATARHLRLVKIGAWGQAAACVIMALTALLYHTSSLPGTAVGITFLIALGMLAVFRALVSLTSKDIQGRTMPKGFRGRVTGFATTISGAVTIVVGVAIQLTQGKIPAWGFAVLFALAAVAWYVSASLFGKVLELPVPDNEVQEAPHGVRETVKDVVADVWDLVSTGKPFRNFVIVRSLMLASALSPTFLVILSTEHSDANLSGLGAFVLSSGLASLVAGPVSGKLSDKSSKNTLSVAALFAVIVILLTIGCALWLNGWLTWWLPVAFFGIAVAHASIRVSRSTYVVDMAEGDMRTRYVSVSNTLMGVILLVIGALTSALSVLGTLWALAALAGFGILGSVLAASLPEVSTNAR